MRGERELALFRDQMQRKLSMNADKGGWKGESPLWLFKRLCEEVRELEEALFADGGHADVDAVRSECADIANFALMVCDLTLPSAKAAGFSFPRGPRSVCERLTSSPRAFKESVCPTASESEIDFDSPLGFREGSSFVGKPFTSGPTPLNRQDSVIKERCANSRCATEIIPRNPAKSGTLRRFILSAEAGGFLASKSVTGGLE